MTTSAPVLARTCDQPQLQVAGWIVPRATKSSHLFAVDLHRAGLDLAHGIAHRFGQPDLGQQLVQADAAVHARRLRAAARWRCPPGLRLRRTTRLNTSAARVGIGGGVEIGDDQLAQRDLGLHGMQLAAGDARAHGVDLGQALIGEQLVVAAHQLVGDLHHLAEHDLGRLGDADVVAQRLGHLVDAVEAFEHAARWRRSAAAGRNPSESRGPPAG